MTLYLPLVTYTGGNREFVASEVPCETAGAAASAILECMKFRISKFRVYRLDLGPDGEADGLSEVTSEIADILRDWHEQHEWVVPAALEDAA